MDDNTSAARHTPGPWTVLEPPGRLPEVWQFGAAECVTDAVYNDNHWLIAAAPDLLAACRQMIDVIMDGDKDDQQAAIDDTRAAIARAEGRTDG